MKATFSTPFATSVGSLAAVTRPERLHVHLVGIGGSGMSGLACLLLGRGAHVSGTDQRTSRLLDMLHERGARISVQQSAESVPADAEVIVASAAINADHPEIAEAHRRGLPVVKYAQMLGRVMAGHDGIAVAGTHGKSTTASWLAYALRLAGRDPSFVIGAEVEQLGGGSGAGKGPQFVVEACEYDRSFLNLKARRAVILNIEEDHLDCYANLDEITGAFSTFAGLLPDEGLLVVNADDPHCRRIATEVTCRVTTIGLNEADWAARDLRLSPRGYPDFEIVHADQPLGRVSILLAGRHNVFNALAVTALACDCGLKWSDIRAGLESFRGARRRLELLGEPNGVRIADDYAHHPTEIRATLAAAREHFRPRRLWCIFQPHQHSRTRALLDEFSRAFADADRVIVPDIYEARDHANGRPDVSAAALVDQIRGTGVTAEHVSDFRDILSRLEREASAGDLVLTMGAGDVWKVADELVRRLSAHLPA